MKRDNTNKFLEFGLSQDAYLAFDAVSLKDFIIKRLNENEKFTDQNYEGSNLAAIIDIIAYSYHVLLFYLNNTASEVDYDQASIYENMNRIVKLIGYKPTGKQTSIVPLKAVATSDLPVGGYTIKKYSYFLIDSIQYTLLKDYSFTITSQEEQEIENINNSALLYQGVIGEYPNYTASGEEYETITIVVDNIINNRDDRFIDGNGIDVYVKEKNTDTYFEYQEVDSLYLYKSTDRVYEKRLNEAGHYEIKFGNGLNGKSLCEGDVVSINYLLSDNEKGIISKNAINGNKLFAYDTQRNRELFEDIYLQDVNYINAANASFINFSNPTNSSTISDEETVDDIRENAAKIFSTQLRLVTEADYNAWFRKIFKGQVSSIKTVDNESYLHEYIDYFYRICVDPEKSNKVLLSQVNFADSCDFNNVNIFTVPKFTVAEDESYPDFTSAALKNKIVEESRNRKMVGAEVVPRDPVYIAYDIGFSSQAPTNKDSSNSFLYVVRDKLNKTDKEEIKSRVDRAIKSFFNVDNNELGQNVNLSTLLSDILSLDGIKRVYTLNQEQNVTFDGISLISLNPVYPNEDVQLVNQNVQLPFFMFPYLYRPNSLRSKIVVVDE